MGRPNYIWSKESDDRLMEEISDGKNMTQLSISFKINTTSLTNHLKEMGFGGLRDARNVLIG